MAPGGVARPPCSIAATTRSYHNDSAVTQTVLVDAARRGNGLFSVSDLTLATEEVQDLRRVRVGDFGRFTTVIQQATQTEPGNVRPIGSGCGKDEC